MIDGPEAITVFDLETTGVDVTKDRIVQAFVGLMGRDGEWIEKREWIVDPGIPIPEGASNVHGITDEFVKEHGVEPALAVEDILNTIYWYMAHSKRGGLVRPVVMFNGAYDFSILTAEAARYDLPETLATVPFVVDPYVCDKAKDKYRRGSRRLVDVAAHYGVPVEANAHDAGADCLMTGRIAWKIIDSWKGTLERLHERQVEWREEQNESLEQYFTKQGKLNDL